jgi:hypothetical protein
MGIPAAIVERIAASTPTPPLGPEKKTRLEDKYAIPTGKAMLTGKNDTLNVPELHNGFKESKIC